MFAAIYAANLHLEEVTPTSKLEAFCSTYVALRLKVMEE